MISHWIRLRTSSDGSHKPGDGCSSFSGSRPAAGVPSRHGRASGVPPAPPSRIRRIADWVLNCVRQVLEHLGLMTAAVPEREASRPPLRPEAFPPAPPLRISLKWITDSGDVDRRFR